MVLYKIENLVNGHFYIGSAKNFSVRKNRHINQLKNNKHHSIYLQRAWNQYGENNFKFSIFKEYKDISYSQLLDYEQYFLTLLKPCYNMNKQVKLLIVSDEGKQRKIDKDSYEWIVMSPEGDEFKIKNLRKFCRDNNLTQSGMWRVANGIGSNHKGWKIRYIYDNEYTYIDKNTKEYKIIFPNGNTLIIRNLSKFCKEHNICPSAMVNVASGKQKQHKGFMCMHVDDEKPRFVSKMNSESMRLRIDRMSKTYKIIAPDGTIQIIKNLKDFCKKNDLSLSCMRRVSNQIRKHHLGYKVELYKDNL